MTFAPDDTSAPHELRITRCREPFCRARIIWLENPATGKNVPVDADTVKPEDEIFDSTKHTSHWRRTSSARGIDDQANARGA